MSMAQERMHSLYDQLIFSNQTGSAIALKALVCFRIATLSSRSSLAFQLLLLWYYTAAGAAFYADTAVHLPA